MNEATAIHPGLLLIACGLLAYAVPANFRKFFLIGGPLAALAAIFSLEVGTDVTLDFVGGYTLHYLFVDKLSFFFCFVYGLMITGAGIYAAHNENKVEALCAFGYAGGGLGVALAGDWLTLIFFWELLAVTSLFLIWENPAPEARRAGWRYILVHMLGGNLLLAGIFFKLSAGDYQITNIAQGPHDIAFWFILLGVAVNAAIPPLSAWCPDAYPESTITGGVFMSSLTTKLSVCVLIRIFGGTELLIYAGTFMALYGASFAVMENDMRRLLSHHIVSQVGFMVAAVGVGTNMALNGAAALAFGNILYKSLLFMCAGAIIYATGIRKINQIGAIAKRLPIVGICFFIAAFSISGVPLWLGFVAKPIAISSTAAAGYDLIYTLLELASIGTFLSIPLKMGYFIFLRNEHTDVEIQREIPKNMYAAMIFNAALCTIFGVIPGLFYRYMPFAGFEYHPFAAAHILSYIEILGIAIVPFLMYLAHMEPHTAISLDTDWFYRKPFAAIVYRVSALCCAVCDALGEFWFLLSNKFMAISKNPMEFLDARPFRKRKRFYARNYRTAIADPMMIMLSVLISCIFYFLTRLQ